MEAGLKVVKDKEGGKGEDKNCMDRIKRRNSTYSSKINFYPV